MDTKDWYTLRTKLASMFSEYIANEITYAEIESIVIGWIEQAQNDTLSSALKKLWDNPEDEQWNDDKGKTS